MNKIGIHKRIAQELTALYERKNHDYGDSFGKSFLEYGMTMPCIRLEDKLNRLKSLTKADAEVMDETIDDTLMDLANYAIMTLVERQVDLTQIVHKRVMYFSNDEYCLKCLLFDRHHGPGAQCETCPHKESIFKEEVVS